MVWEEFSGLSWSAVERLAFPMPLEESSPVLGKGVSQTVSSVAATLF